MEFFTDLAGKSALVTGASSGIGHHFAKTLAKAGVTVVLAARRADRLESAVETITAEGGSASWVQMDVTDSQGVRDAFTETLNRCERLDIVINNAGVASGTRALLVSEAEWDDVIDTNLNGAWTIAQNSGLAMSKDGKGGSLINIASILGKRVMGGVAPYAASKAALEHLTRVLAFEWAEHGIRVNAIAPGYIVTDINRKFLSSAAGERARHKIPQKRFGETSDLDGAMLLLASDASSYMTGSTIVVDGGHLQSSM